MSINFCTIARSSVDSFCGGRREIVLNRLLAQKYPPPFVATPGGNPRVLRDTFALHPPFEFDDRPTLNFEQPQIAVSVALGKVVKTQVVDNDLQKHFVSVTDLAVEKQRVVVSDLTVMTASEPIVVVSDLSFSTSEAPSVEVSDLTFEEVDVAVNITDIIF
jgi:hypothetical protein